MKGAKRVRSELCNCGLISGLWIGTMGTALFTGKIGQALGFGSFGAGIWVALLVVLSAYISSRDAKKG